MTHFTVLVCCKDPSELDELLAPYDENTEAEPRRDYINGLPQDFWAVESLRAENGLNPNNNTLTWQEVADAYNARYRDDMDEENEDDTERLRIDENGRPYTMTTYNPDSKWDWWVVGGRWGGAFPIRPGHEDEVIRPERQWSSPEVIEPDHCDGGPKRALDLDRMRQDAEDRARATYREYQKLVAGTPEALPWSVFRENISEGTGYTVEQARIEYNGQPRVQRLRKSKFDYFLGDAIEDFSVSEELYAQRARLRAVPGYALLTLEGDWVAPGEMGWWGMSSDNQQDRDAYGNRVNAYIDSCPDDTWFVMVDCHIL